MADENTAATTTTTAETAAEPAVEQGMLEAVQAGLKDMAADSPAETAPAAQEGDAAAKTDDGTAAAADAAAKPADAATKTPEEIAADEAAKKAADAATAEAAGKDEDEGLPDGVLEKTRARFEKLTTQKKEIAAELTNTKTERDRYKADADEWHQTVASTGATPEQFSTVLGYLANVNKGGRQGLEAAYDMLNSELTGIAKLLGREVPGVFDPLSLHPDLAEKVAAMEITPEAAKELARYRAASTLDTHEARRQSETQRQQQASQQAEQQAFGAIRDLGGRLAASDPNYRAKVTAERAQVMIDTITTSGAPPQNWPTMFEKMYRAIPDPVAVAAPAAAAASTKVPDPIRPSSAGAASTAKTPTTMLEAVQMAISR